MQGIKRNRIIVLILCAVALLVTGCGDVSEPDKNNQMKTEKENVAEKRSNHIETPKNEVKIGEPVKSSELKLPKVQKHQDIPMDPETRNVLFDEPEYQANSEHFYYIGTENMILKKDEGGIYTRQYETEEDYGEGMRDDSPYLIQADMDCHVVKKMKLDDLPGIDASHLEDAAVKYVDNEMLVFAIHRSTGSKEYYYRVPLSRDGDEEIIHTEWMYQFTWFWNVENSYRHEVHTSVLSRLDNMIIIYNDAEYNGPSTGETDTYYECDMDTGARTDITEYCFDRNYEPWLASDGAMYAVYYKREAPYSGKKLIHKLGTQEFIPCESEYYTRDVCAQDDAQVYVSGIKGEDGSFCDIYACEKDNPSWCRLFGKKELEKAAGKVIASKDAVREMASCDNKLYIELRDGVDSCVICYDTLSNTLFKVSGFDELVSHTSYQTDGWWVNPNANYKNVNDRTVFIQTEDGYYVQYSLKGEYIRDIPWEENNELIYVNNEEMFFKQDFTDEKSDGVELVYAVPLVCKNGIDEPDFSLSYTPFNGDTYDIETSIYGQLYTMVEIPYADDDIIVIKDGDTNEVKIYDRRTGDCERCLKASYFRKIAISGHKMYYSAKRKGHYSVWMLDFKTGKKKQVPAFPKTRRKS